MKTKSQVSLEFMIIFGISFFIVMSLVGIFFTYSGEASREIDRKYIDRTANKIINEIENVYYLGYGNRVTLKFNFPENIFNVTIGHFNNIVNGETIKFDTLNFEVLGDNENLNLTYMTNLPSIRFNCSISCSHSSSVSYFNDTSLFAQGPKEVRIESFGSYVSVDFIREE